MSAEGSFDSLPAESNIYSVSRPHTNVTCHCACRCVVVMPSMLPLCLSSSCVLHTVQPRDRSIWMVSGTKQNLQAILCLHMLSSSMFRSSSFAQRPAGNQKFLHPTPAPTWRLLMNGCGMPVPQWIALFSELVQCRSSHCTSKVSLQTDGWRVITVIFPNNPFWAPQVLFQQVLHRTNDVKPVNPEVSCYMNRLNLEWDESMGTERQSATVLPLLFFLSSCMTLYILFSWKK